MANNPWKRGIPPEPPRRPSFIDREVSTPGSVGPARPLPPQGPPGSGRTFDLQQKSMEPTLGSVKQRSSRLRDKQRSITPVVGLIALLLVSSIIFHVARRGSEERALDGRKGLTTSPSASSSVSSASTSPSLPRGNWDRVARSVVYIEAAGSRCGWSGSGSLVLDGSYVLTNQHVSGSGECDLAVFFTQSASLAPTIGYTAVLVVYDVAKDLAVLRIFDSAGNPMKDSSRPSLAISTAALSLGSTIYTLGYPAAGGSTITFTSGDYSGMDDVDGVYYKTTAYMNSGVSGGAALDEAGQLIGVPTAGKIDPDTKQNLGINLIRPIRYATELLAQAEEKNVSGATGASMVAQGEEEDGAVVTDGSSESRDPIFDTCREAKQRGLGPYYIGIDYEYDYYFDRDGDGVVCE